MTVAELIAELQKRPQHSKVFDTDGHPIIGASVDYLECGCCVAPGTSVYIEAEF